jgi:Protein of unknown function (DUF3568)
MATAMTAAITAVAPLRRGVLGLLIVVGALSLQGCAAIGLTLIGSGVGIGAGAGTGHALDSIVYKTFTVPMDTLSKATVVTLNRMDIELVDTEATEEGQIIKATAADRKIEIEFDRLTPKTTRMRVVAKRNWLIRDRATATEIILQTDRTLTEQTQQLAAPGPRPASPPPARKAQK